MTLDSFKLDLATRLAGICNAAPPVETALRLAFRTRLGRASGLGAVANGYPRLGISWLPRWADLDDYRLLVNVAEWSGVACYFQRQRGVSWVAEVLVKPGATCVDVGANYGLYAIFLGSRVGSRGRVFAMEPSPKHQAAIQASAEVNGFESTVRVDGRAAWSVTGATKTLRLSSDSANSATSSLVSHHRQTGREEEVPVTTTSLDDFFAEAGIEHCDFLKIDVERAEHEVLAELARTLALGSIDAILLEAVWGDPALRKIQEAGYEGWHVDEGADRLVPGAEMPDGTFGDFLFLPTAMGKSAREIRGGAR